MIGSGLKKLANKEGLRIDGGIAYGSLRGFASTLCEGAGWKAIVITTTFPEGGMDQLQAQVAEVDVSRQFRVQNLSFGSRQIGIRFLDNPGTMKRIEEFIDWFYPMLERSGATGADICTVCGTRIEDGKWMQIDGVAWYFHDSCVQMVVDQIGQAEETRKEQDTGSYGKGFIGAMLGAILGAVVWALLLMAGYLAGLAGLLIGWLAEKGYTLLKGKRGKGKLVILIIATLFGVVLGCLGGELLSLIRVISEGGTGYAVADAPALLLALFLVDAAVRAGMIKNFLVGLVLAALGVFSVLAKAKREVSGTKISGLK